WIVDGFKKSEGIDLRNDGMAMQRLREAAEKAKIELSNMTETTISLPFITANQTGPKHLEMKLTRAKFEEMTADLLDRTVKPTQRALSDSGLSAGEVDKILLVGGSTRMPMVQKKIVDLLGKEPTKGINPDECVAAGAAIQGAILKGDHKDIVLVDVTPLTLGIETLGGVMTKMIERNTAIPAHASQIFTTAADNQPQVEIMVFQGERPMAQDNVKLGQFTLDGIAPAPRGIPQIEVSFDIDTNGIVNVKAKDKGTGKEQKITIQSSNLSKDDIEKMKRDAEEHAADDEKRRAAAETRNEADAAVFQAEKLMNDLGDKMNAEEKGRVNTKIDALKKAIESNNESSMKSAKDDLMKTLQEFGARLYQNAGPSAGANPGASSGSSNDSDTVDAEFSEK
ncbi:MAG: Hsp70 family protein, partial [Synergistaceae bacterium]|nr:Hsp70 family protein [Synergistaceae bacterium]